MGLNTQVSQVSVGEDEREEAENDDDDGDQQ